MRTRSQKEITPTIFTRAPKRKAQSEPIVETKKIKINAPPPERDLPLTKQDMLRIISSETPLDRAAILENFVRSRNIKRQEVPTIYSSYFFRKDIIKDFQSNVLSLVPQDKLVGFPLSTYKLYNKDDILNNTTYRPDLLGTRTMEKTVGYSTESTNNMKLFIDFLSKNICSDIGSHYAQRAVERAIDLTNNEQEFDILIASTRIIEDVSLPINERLAGVVAFIIVELGECKKYPKSYSINLICTDTKIDPISRRPKTISGTGSVLMGAFLYTILCHPIINNPNNQINFPPGNGFLKVSSKQLSDGSIIENCFFGSEEPLIPVQHIAVLELANAYTNTGGLCMYEKFGFTYDQTMFSNRAAGIDCFSDRFNLPMIIDFMNKPGYAELDIISKRNLVAQITAGVNRGFPKSIICGIRDEPQKLLGYLKSIVLYIENEPGSRFSDYPLNTIEGKLINALQTALPSTRRTVVPPFDSNTINNIINYIENPPQIEDENMKRKINVLIGIIQSAKKTIGGYSKKNKTFNKRFTKKHRNF